MALHKAFNEFQIAADIKPTGGLHRGEETEKALIAALPQELQRLTGVKDHAIAFAEGAGNTTSVSFSRIPKAMLAAIEPVAKAIEDTLGLPLVPREPPRNRAGRIDLRIGVGYGVFLDSRGRPMADDKAPDAIRAAVAKVLKSDPRLDLDPNAAPGRMVISMLADSASVRELNQDFADLHIDFNVRDTMLAVVELDEALDEELGFGLPTAAGAGETALKYAEKLGFDSVHSAKLIDSGGTKALLAEVPRRASVSKKILDFLSQPPKIIAVKVAEAVGKTAKGSALEVIVIGGLGIMKVVTETTEWEESVGNFVRVRPETLCRITEFSEHESNGRELDEGERVAVEVLPVLGQSAAAVEPGDGAFDHPTPGLDDEALHPIGSLDDLGLEIGQDAGQGAVKDRPLIGAVGEQFPEKGKQTEQGRQQRETAGAILNVGGGDDAVQQQALRIDQNMPLLALDQLAGIEAVAVDASPPFSALFTL